MNRTGWPMLEVAARLLEPRERDIVLGDLEESGENAWVGLAGVLGLFVRRQTFLWKSWRPWAAALGLALPGSFLLMGFSLSVSASIQGFTATSLAISHIFLLLVWSWTGGFVISAVSRKTLWVSIAASCIPCLFCLSRYKGHSLPWPCLVIFLVPAVFGVRRGLRTASFPFWPALVLAVGTTLCTIPMWNEGLPSLNWLLIWPGWYLVITSRSKNVIS
jgi:hypothetical protein